MANTTNAGDMSPDLPIRSILSKFELLITCNPPVLESLLAQIPTETILRLYHTSFYLREFLQGSPTAWRYVSWRLFQPAATTATITNNSNGTGPRQSSNYALDQLLIYVINPFSTRLVSLELDNTAVSGGTLTQTVLILRRDTLQHVSVRGCKNVSLKYHINPWLQIHALARERPGKSNTPGYDKLALKSLYTYRCRHHRRRPYLPSSLTRKESDSEPTHELVITCHKLGIWTDTAWCTTPGARCYRRRGYVTMRVPQDPREVWVVYDRLWRSRNWLGSTEDGNRNVNQSPGHKRKRDARSWEYEEEAVNGEAIGISGEGKLLPAHLRQSHRQFVEDVTCQNCSSPVLERCEQCSVMMHCTGCRKTLCASCAFDRPYLRNSNAPEEDRNKFWWAPGCAISPCSMQDQDPPPTTPGTNIVVSNTNLLPNIKFRWCCTEPVFSGGGGITFGNGLNRDSDRVRAAPLKIGQGWEDPEFTAEGHEEGESGVISQSLDNLVGTSEQRPGPGGRWSSVDDLFQGEKVDENDEEPPLSVPRLLCNECYNSERWKVKCKACSVALCLRHDVQDRLKVRICGYKDLVQEKQEFKSRQQARKILTSLLKQKKELQSGEKQNKSKNPLPTVDMFQLPHFQRLIPSAPEISSLARPDLVQTPLAIQGSSSSSSSSSETIATRPERMTTLLSNYVTSASDAEPHLRPLSRGSSSTGPPSRSSSPTPSTRSLPDTPEPSSAPRRIEKSKPQSPRWRGCQSFFCPAIRSPGDHRRRCVALMRQCTDCKIHVCSDCVVVLDAPCPCKGCRPPDQTTSSSSSSSSSSSTDPSAADPAAVSRFFCPNCRWDRMVSGKCKRRRTTTEASQTKKGKRREAKPKKPVNERCNNITTNNNNNNNNNNNQDEAIDGLVEFFSNLNAQLTDNNNNNNSTDFEDDDGDGDGDEGGGNDHEGEGRGNDDEGEGHDDEGPTQHSIHELEDMGALARDLIRRIQRLRGQFQPGSLAAMALPDVRLEEIGRAGGSDTDILDEVLAVVVGDTGDTSSMYPGAGAGTNASASSS